MENKYYTPELREFHVGFEFEMDAGTGWSKQIFPNPWWNNGGMGGIDALKRCVEDQIVRVKYLDREDIESLGWKVSGTSYLWKNGSAFLEFYPNDNLNVEIDSGGANFTGTIRNKRELARLMKMLNI